MLAIADTHVPLLGRLAVWFNEAIVTDGLRLLLDDPTCKESFLGLINERSDCNVNAVCSFDREIGIPGGRIDLVGLDEAGRPRVIVEAKFGHAITAAQIQMYLAYQQSALGALPGALILLVPASRVAEAQSALEMVDAGGGTGTIRMVVLSWEECLQKMLDQLPAESAGPVSVAADVEQLLAVCTHFSGWTAPLSSFVDEGRQQHLRDLLNTLTERVSSELPWRGPLVARDPAHLYRYFGVDNAGNYISVGLLPGWEERGHTPLWLRLPHGTPRFEIWRGALRRSTYRDHIREVADDLWLPLLIAPELGGPALIEELVSQMLAIVSALQAA